MWKKEFREIIKPVAAILSVSIIVPILALFNVPLGRTFNMIAVVIYHVFTGVYGNIYLLSFVFLLGILVLWAANMLGFGVFKYEYKDKAFEYLFAFPFSKYRIQSESQAFLSILIKYTGSSIFSCKTGMKPRCLVFYSLRQNILVFFFVSHFPIPFFRFLSWVFQFAEMGSL